MTALDRLRQVIDLTTGPRRYDIDQFSEIIADITADLVSHPDPTVAALAAQLRNAVR